MAENKRSRQPNGASSIYFGKDGKWHGRVTVGVRDDGKPDRRHIERKTKAEVTRAVREMERARDEKKLRKPGQSWTVQAWLEHWVENIAKPYVSENTYDGYEVDVRVHLVPGLGAHKLDKLEPEHLERFYRRMQETGSSAGTAHHAHRTIRVALGEAKRRGHVATNVAEIAKAPRLEEEDIEPFTIEEVQSLLVEAAKLRNSARWVVALALGLRQGRRSDFTGKTSTWTRDTCASARTGFGPSTPTAVETTRAAGKPATAPRSSRPAESTSPPSLAPGVARSGCPTR